MDSYQGKNGESVGFSPDGKAYYTLSEGKRGVVCEFRLERTGGS